MSSRRRSALHVAIALCAMGCVHVARADFALTLSGYGTVGVVHSDNGRADYIADLAKPNGVGVTRETSFDVDTRFAGQATLKVTPSLTGVVQVIAQQRYDNTYRPTLEWANVKYDITPDLSVRAGRVVLPIFLVTDTRRVGFANAWARPPVEVYNMVPVSNSDGVDASYRLNLGHVANTLNVTAGRTTPKFPAEQGGGSVTKVQARKLLAVVDTLESGSATLKLSYGRANLTLDTVNVLFDAYRQLGPAGVAIADRYDLRDRQVSFVGLGANFDPGPWFATAEWAKFETHSVLGGRSAWYVSGGYRWGKFTPYATYARTRPETSTSDPGLPPGLFPPTVAPIVAGLNAALNAQLANSPEQATFSLGVRWDFRTNAALKLQFDDVRPADNSFGTFNRIQPGLAPGTRTRLLSVLVDVVF